MRTREVSAGMRRLAGHAQKAFPTMNVHHHLRDAAAALDAQNTAGATRHLHAAIAQLTPQSVSRHGFTDDESHTAAKSLMGDVARHGLLVKDVADRQDGPQEHTAADVHAIELARRTALSAVGLSSEAVHNWLPDADEDWFSTRPRPPVGETVDEVRACLGIGVPRERPGDRLDVGALVRELGLA